MFADASSGGVILCCYTSKEELAFEQQLIRVNNRLGAKVSSEIFVVDRQYARPDWKQERIDSLAQCDDHTARESARTYLHETREDEFALRYDLLANGVCVARMWGETGLVWTDLPPLFTRLFLGEYVPRFLLR